MLTPILTSPVKRKRKTGNHVATHHVGDGKRMTTGQIASQLGCDPAVIRNRIKLGWKDAELLTPLGVHRHQGRPRNQTQTIALKLALTFGRRVPSVEQIRVVHPMGVAAATYWRNGYRHAMKALEK